MCFITREQGREAFLGDRIGLRPGRVVDATGDQVGSVGAVELVTIGQRKGLGLRGHSPQYVVDIDASGATVTVGDRDDLATVTTPLDAWRWTGRAVAGQVELQTSAHGAVASGTVDEAASAVR
ncbi:MAG: tRNA methyl transferase PRC-barrel domain-containing protein [Acidimicrobiales bacterium]